MLKITGTCKTDNCNKSHFSRGMCRPHYMKFYSSPYFTKAKKDSVKTRLLKNIEKRDNGCWEWIGRFGTRGYGCIDVSGVSIGSHRVMYTETFGEIKNGLLVLHKCDNPKCINPEHLFLGTNTDNIADMISKGRQARGVKSGSAKLSERDVLEIRHCHSDGCSLAALSKKFGVCASQVDRIVRRVQWRHI